MNGTSLECSWFIVGFQACQAQAAVEHAPLANVPLIKSGMKPKKINERPDDRAQEGARQSGRALPKPAPRPTKERDS